jgi:hypothetical protein
MDTKKATSLAAITFGVLAVLVGAALFWGATTVLVGDRDAEGFYMSESYAFEVPTRAIVSADVRALTDVPAGFTSGIADPGELRIRSTTASPEGLFIGIATTVDADHYLGKVPLHEVTALDFDGSSIAEVEFEAQQATGVPAPPGDSAIWVAWTASDQSQTLDWEIEPGDWTAVVMNSDGSFGIDADLAVGAGYGGTAALAWPVAVIGLILLAGGLYAMYRGLRRPTKPERVEDLREEAPPIEVPPMVKEPAHTG